MTEPLLQARDLTIQYKTNQGMLTAVSNASFEVREGEYFGIVGESGCGKSTIADAIMGGLAPNGHITSGKIIYRGKEIQDYTEKELNKNIRWKEISWIPQSSLNSLNPLEPIKKQALELSRTHTDLSDEEALEQFKEVFEVVGLQESRIHDYPHQFSGGMQQRTIIALALFLNPSLIIADEPTTALDVIMQDQILGYVDKIRNELSVSMILVTHDIGVIFETCDTLAVMHAGQVAESGPTEEVYDNPRHPYTILLQDAFPDLRYPNRKLQTIPGNPPQLMGDVDYCTFAERCPWSISDCNNGSPPFESIESEEDEFEHHVSCIRQEEIFREYEGTNVRGQPTDRTNL